MSISTACVLFLPGCGFVGLPVLALVNHGIPETRSFQKRMRLDFPERALSILDTICGNDTHCTKAQEIARCRRSLLKAPGDLIPNDC